MPNRSLPSALQRWILPLLAALPITFALALPATPALAAEVFPIDESTDMSGMSGKEVDWIYGDYLLRNEHVVAVIARPVEGRNANMTVRNVGASIIDLTLRDLPNDQLSAYYPAAGRYSFHDPDLVEISESAEGEVSWRCRSSAPAADGTSCTVTYRLGPGDAFVSAEVEITAPSGDGQPPASFDGVRADRTFRFAGFPEGGPPAVFCEDRYFRQTYGFVHSAAAPRWGKQRMRTLTYPAAATEQTADQTSPAGPSWRVRLYPATSPLDLASALAATDDRPATLQRITLHSDIAPADHAVVQIVPAGIAPSDAWNTLQADAQGRVATRLASGRYDVHVRAPGYADTKLSLDVDDSAAEHRLTLPTPSAIRARVQDGDGDASPFKMTIYGREGTPDPDFGPDSAAGSIVNCVYCVSGSTTRTLPPGQYEVILSRGPEFDAVFRQIEVKPGEIVELDEQLIRSVDTEGWVSAELHSHSSPSGDNTSSQRGRVQNLLCEHLEFAPCTEHNRVDSYQPHLEALGAEALLSSCTGIEVTGSPLPVNHQNAFPLHHHPHTQDGGGPHTDTNPIAQIERLAMWDDGSEKVVQGNHPNIRQIYGDRDTDGQPDDGFRAMLGFMDVIEVHPPQAIFNVPDKAAPPREAGNRMFRWMQLLNAGYRIPGVVNTDAHYNHHGSGWLRNWFESSTDDPAKIKIADMIHAAQHGHVVMSTGPFMEVQLSSESTENGGGQRTAGIGDELRLEQDPCRLHVRIQCPNWLDINRVQVFANGRMLPEHNYRRRTHAAMFADGVVKFDQTLPLELAEDAHIIVAAIGEGLTLGRVMGPTRGTLPPVVVSNPIFVDRNGDGFRPNGDDLGIPLPEVTAPFRPDQSRLPAPVPEDAVVLLGEGVNRFVNKHGEPADWKQQDGVLVVTPGEGRSNHLCSTELFRDAEIHAEFRLPERGPGNSGLYIHGNYEMQIYNSAGRRPDKQTAGALYGFYPPLVNAVKPPGEWQVYDIRYHAPRRDAEGKITTPGRLTAWLNGYLVQNDVTFDEPRSVYHPFRYRTSDYLRELAEQQKQTSRGPLFLQDHNNPVAFRNVWIRRLDETEHAY